jgi:phosphate transport system protein
MKEPKTTSPENLDESMTKTHTNREYENELNAVRLRLTEMADRVEQMLHDAVRSFETMNLALARETITKDKRVNRDEMELDELCLLILARRQPLGADLRFITIALKMVTDLERIGDLAVNICERVLKLGAEKKTIKVPQISEMNSAVSIMLREAMQAFSDSNTTLAENVLNRDDAVDETYHKIIRELLEKMLSSPDDIEALIHVQSIAKWLERIGDHCTNLAELVVFMVRGEDIRHMGKLDLRQIARIDSILPSS